MGTHYDIICFTGHRIGPKMGGWDENNTIAVAVRAELEKAIRACVAKHGTSLFVSGGALGVDMWAAEIVLRLRDVEKIPIKLLMAIPCVNQESRWRAEQQKRYRDILAKADGVHYCSKAAYDNTCMHRRDEWMIDNSHGFIAVWDGSNGGTGHTANYGISKNLPMYRMHPGTECKITPFPEDKGKLIVCNVDNPNVQADVKIQIMVGGKLRPGWQRIKSLAPSPNLFNWYKASKHEKGWFTEYTRRFMSELDMNYLDRFCNRVLELNNQGRTVAIACSCADYTLCHRLLIGNLAKLRGIEVLFV